MVKPWKMNSMWSVCKMTSELKNIINHKLFFRLNMESLINFLLDKIYKTSIVPQSAFDVKLDIKSENEWNKWIESLNKMYRAKAKYL